MNTKLITFFIGSLFFLSFNLSAQQTITISSSRQQLIIGDPLSVIIKATYKPDQIRSFPTFNLLVGKNPFELLKTVSTDTLSLENGDLEIINELLLTSFEPGQYLLGPIKLLATGQRMTNDSISSNSLQVKVLPLPLRKDSAEIKPIRDIWKENKNWQDWLPIIYGIVGILLLVLIILWLKKRKKTKVISPVHEPEKISPAQEALEKMEWLSKQKFLQEKDFVNFHYELGIIFRSFLEKQFEVHVLDLPSSEMLEKIQNLPVYSMLTLEMIHWMKTADFIKFAKLEPHFSFHEEAFLQVRQFLTQFLIEESSITSENK